MQAHTYSHNKQHLIRDGKPWIPTMGEIHYSRCQHEYWRESVRLMKSGGLQIIASYIFWNHHEAKEGVFDFSGCRDIGRFLDICDEENMPVFLRIGPWCHGEVRHGGFPDWLLESGCEVRSNDSKYMAYVRRFWEAIYEQIKRHIGGCIIGIQYENEFHGDNSHMIALEKLADEIGIVAPLHTATGWGSSPIGTSMPVYGGYPDEPWHWRLDKLPPSSNYIFSHIHDDNNIGANEVEGENMQYEPCFDQDDYPYLTAEIGGGCQPTFRRRPIAAAKDVGGIMNIKLGSGTVMPGIYVYHGGTNPGYSLQESKSWGNGTECPELNYDFQAPISEYGKPTDTYKQLRRIFTFLKDFGEGLAVMPTVFPADNPISTEDLKSIRYCYRTDGNSGYLFVNNYVRGYDMPKHTHTFTLPTENGDITFPEMIFENGDFGFFPFNMPIGKAKLVSANAQPLCVLNNSTYVFFTDRTPIYNTEDDISGIKFLTLSQEDSLKASKVTIGEKDYLILCDAPYTRDGDDLVFSITSDTPLRIYPNPNGDNGFAEYILKCPKENLNISSKLISSNPLMKEFSINVDSLPQGASDLLLDIEYDGNIIELFANGQKVADQYSMGNGWHIGLRRFGGQSEFTLRIFALAENAQVYIERKPTFKDGYACALKEATLKAEYPSRFSFSSLKD